MKLINIYKELLTEDFKSQRINFIKQGYESNIVDDYIEKFKHIRDAKYKSIGDDILNFNIEVNDRLDIDKYKNFRDLEVFVDYVSGKHAVKTNLKVNDIVVDGKPIYNNNGIEVYYADSPRACIKYKGNVPYSWCVARSDSSNMFYTYRFKPYEPAFYFIKDVQATKKELGVWNMAKNVFSGSFNNKYHFFVIQVPKNLNINDNELNQYIVTSANNDGDKQMSWNEIIELNPKLKDIKEVLQPKPFTPEERKSHEKFKNGIDDREFSKLSYEDKRTYLDVYPTINRPITTNQFLALPDDLKNLYLSFGIGLDDNQFNSIKDNKKLLKRYTQISEKKYEQYIKSTPYERRRLIMMYSELIVLKDENIKGYLNTLDKSALYDFIKNNSREKLELLEKYVKDKLASNYDEVKELLIGLKNNDEDALNSFNEMLSDDVYVDYNGKEYLTFELPRDFSLKNDLNEIFNFFENRYYDYGYYGYFEGNDDALDNTVEDLVEEAMNDEDVSDYIKIYGFKKDADIIIEFLIKFDKLDDIKETINETYNSAAEESKQKAYDELRDKYSETVEYYDGESFLINKDMFINTVLTDNNIFNDLKDNFEDTIQELIIDLFNKQHLPTETSGLYEEIDNYGWDFNVDKTYLVGKVKENIIEAFNEYSENEDDEDNEDDDTFSKFDVLIKLNKILKSLKQDESANSIENDLVKIDFNRKQLAKNSIYTTFYDKKNNKSYDGYMNLDEIPNYFLNYKLFEEIKRIKRIING